jgi:flagellar protein FlgJ
MQRLAIDTQSLGDLRARAKRDEQGALKEAAKQFEGLFMQEVMKRMRAASLEVGLVDNEMSKMSTEMLDQQYAQAMSGLPGGLSAAIERQLGVKQARPQPSELPSVTKAAVPEKQARFLLKHEAAAKTVAEETGIPASFMLAQAAHETGWGGGRIKMRDGSDSHNLFGIKAGKGWTGKVAEVTTTEYVDGVPRKVTAKFRAYESAEDAFRDYAQLLTGNRRYAEAVQAAQATAGTLPGSGQQFALKLQKAGYATDPDYANKLSRVINTTLRLQRALA